MTRPILLTSVLLWFKVVADVEESHLRVVRDNIYWHSHFKIFQVDACTDVTANLNESSGLYSKLNPTSSTS